MAARFHERFEIEVGLEEAKRRFVNRVHGWIFGSLLDKMVAGDRPRIVEDVIIHLGEKPKYQTSLDRQVGDDFHTNLRALEALYQVLRNTPPEYKSRGRYYSDPYASYRGELKELVSTLLHQSESDLGVKWKNGQFYRSGAALLDDKLVNDALHWLRSPGYETVIAPYEKGLSHFLHASTRPELLSDVITDMYEAIEALAKIVTGRPDKDLSANREIFLAKVKASDGYKPLLKDYIEYANKFRHAAKDGQSKTELSPKEVESFIYLTGLFIRLAMP